MLIATSAFRPLLAGDSGRRTFDLFPIKSEYVETEMRRRRTGVPRPAIVGRDQSCRSAQ